MLPYPLEIISLSAALYSVPAPRDIDQNFMMTRKTTIHAQIANDFPHILFGKYPTRKHSGKRDTGCHFLIRLK